MLGLCLRTNYIYIITNHKHIIVHLLMHKQISELLSQTQNEIQYKPVREFLQPPNPIMTKSVDNIDEKVHFRIQTGENSQQNEQCETRKRRQTQKSINNGEQQKSKEVNTGRVTMQKLTLSNGYQQQTLIFKKYDNRQCNNRGNHIFFASVFVKMQSNRAGKLPEYKGMLRDNDLMFDSNFQSGNLLAVYKVEENTYDLILQNDVNTHSFTQWYNFKVYNNRVNFIAKFNIVNLYKGKSLYSMGMKPIVRSQRSDKNTKRMWRRRGFHIYYDKNDLNYQCNGSKCYKTLSFQYDFTVQKDTVQFAHGIPYDLNDLHKLLESIKTNPKVNISTIGNTIMGKSIPLIKLSSLDKSNKMEKKAIIILARQHPGETPGSYIVQQIILDLLKNSNQVDFLIWRFDFYIFPMVNQDGVALGNYRSNFAGFDLNRCWQKPDPIKQPQVVAIKNFVKKIYKKQPIQLILDLHGHSRKIGSFFYGNSFGTNYELFPFIASKGNRNILFEKSRFSKDVKAKESTARVVLGNMIKQTGHVFTYEVSFFGNYKQDNVNIFSFTEEHYKEMSKTLVISIYKTFLEMYKEEKTLRESMYLKGIKNQIIQINQTKGQTVESGSDSQADLEMEEEQQEIQQFFIKQNYEFEPTTVDQIKLIERQISKKSKQLIQAGVSPQHHNEEIKQKIEQLLDRNINEDLRNILIKRLPSITQKQEEGNSRIAEAQKQYLRLNQIIKSHNKYQDIDQVRKNNINPARLKIYGETFELKFRSHTKSQKITKKGHGYSIQEKYLPNNVHKLKQNMLLISNHDIKQTNSKQRQTNRKMNTLDMNEAIKIIPMLESQHQKSRPYKIKNKIHNNSNSPLKDMFSGLCDDIIQNTMVVNRLQEQKGKKHLNSIKNNPKTSKQLDDKTIKLPVL